jgi:Protein of unknown function (DUF1559)
MSFYFTCPYCYLKTEMEEDALGQTGFCTYCGSEITIERHPRRSWKQWNDFLLKHYAEVGVIILIGLAFASLLIPFGFDSQLRTPSLRTATANNMKQIALALHNYHDRYGSFPPAVVCNAEGKPLYSWRVPILPFIEEQELYEKFDKTKAWNDPVNLKLCNDNSIFIFRSPYNSGAREHNIDYFVFVGENTMFPPDKVMALSDCLDFKSNTLLLVEAHGAQTSWAAPCDIDATTLQFTASTNVKPDFVIAPQSAENRTLVVLVDGTTRDIPLQKFKTLLPELIHRRDGKPEVDALNN